MVELAVRIAAIALVFFQGDAMATKNVAAQEQRILNLAFQATGQAGDLVVKFVGYRDNRCAAGATCAQPGDAQAFLRIYARGSAPQFVTLQWAAPGQERQPRFVTRYGEYALWLNALEPRRGRGEPDPAIYRAVMTVSRPNDSAMKDEAPAATPLAPIGRIQRGEAP